MNMFYLAIMIAPLYWQKDFDNDYILQREWRLRRFTSQPNNIMVVLQLAAFDEDVDSIQMILKLMEQNNLSLRIVFRLIINAILQ